MIQDLLEAAIDLLKTLSFGFNNAVAVFIDDEIAGRAAGFWLFLSNEKDVAVRWLGTTETTASLSLKKMYEDNLKDIRNHSAGGLAIIMAELTRAADGYADSLERFSELYSDMLNVDTPQEGIAKLEAKAKSVIADKMVEQLMAGMFGKADPTASVQRSRRDQDITDFRNASLYRP